MYVQIKRVLKNFFLEIFSNFKNSCFFTALSQAENFKDRKQGPAESEKKTCIVVIPSDDRFAVKDKLFWSPSEKKISDGGLERQLNWSPILLFEPIVCLSLLYHF